MADGGVLAVALDGRTADGSCQVVEMEDSWRPGDASAANCYVGHGEPIDGQADPQTPRTSLVWRAKGIWY